MSKMRMPEMDAVRFQESDVIVASGLSNVLRINHFNDGTKSNGTITVGSTVYGYDPSLAGSGVTDQISGSIYDITSRGIEVRHSGSSAGWISLHELISSESTAGYTADGADDGVYHYNPSSKNYDWYSYQ